jgi:hypothetical protein
MACHLVHEHRERREERRKVGKGEKRRRGEEWKGEGRNGEERERLREREREREREGCFPLIKKPVISDEDLTLMTSFSLNFLLKPLCLNTVIIMGIKAGTEFSPWHSTLGHSKSCSYMQNTSITPQQPQKT